MSNENFIEVSFERGRVGVSKWICEANPKDHIRWESDFPFVIHFDRISPLGSMIFHSGKNGKRYFIETTVVYDPGGRGARKFSYYLASCQGEAMDIVDPEIIIPRPPGRD